MSDAATNNGTSATQNENWNACPQCGEPVLVDPATGQSQPCANCASLASKDGSVFGVVLLIAGVAAIIALVYYCIQLLL